MAANTADSAHVAIELSAANNANPTNSNNPGFYSTVELGPQHANFDDGNLMRRPSLRSLKLGTRTKSQAPETVAEEGDEDIDQEQEPPSASKKFGTFDGVTARCLLNIWGVIMFLRVGWIVGNAGILETTLIMIVAVAVTAITTVSLSAICTNGEVKGGGAYFLISRSLGPEFGGSIGILFSIANAVSVAMYLVGFAEAIVSVYNPNAVDADYIIGAAWDLRVWATITLVLLQILAIIGVSWVIKTDMFLFGTLTVAIISFYIGSGTAETSSGFTGYSSDTFSSNWLSNYSNGESFFSVFSIFFPAVTGIMAGANISGDLKDAQKSIPSGTMWAVVVSAIVYVSMAWICGATVTTAELQDNFYVMTDITFWTPLIYIGIFASTLSSGLAALVGAPRIFKAVCDDHIFPRLDWFSVARAKDGEPVRAYGLASLIAFGCICIGDLNAIAPLITMFFLVSYAFVNFSCFALSFSRAPGWRPSFKAFNAWLSLFGAVVCIVVMFLINEIYSLVTVFVGIVLYAYVNHTQPPVNWGSAGQARSYIRAADQIYRMQSVRKHVKTERPSYLLLPASDSDTERKMLYAFSRQLKAGRGLVVLGEIFNSAFSHDNATDATQRRQRIEDMLRGYERSLPKKSEFWQQKNQDQNFACVESVFSENRRHGVQTLLQTAGVGALRPNCVMMCFPKERALADANAQAEFVDIIRDSFAADFGTLLLRNWRKLETLIYHAEAKRGFIDVWWLADDGGLTLLVAWLLSQHTHWSDCRLRVLVPAQADQMTQSQADVIRMLAKFRIKATVEAVDAVFEAPQSKHSQDVLSSFDAQDPHLQKMRRFLKLGECVAGMSHDSTICFVTMPFPKADIAPSTYIQMLDAVCGGGDVESLPPMVLMRGNQQQMLTYYA